jgi:hypothetical protein
MTYRIMDISFSRLLSPLSLPLTLFRTVSICSPVPSQLHSSFIPFPAFQEIDTFRWFPYNFSPSLSFLTRFTPSFFRAPSLHQSYRIGKAQKGVSFLRPPPPRLAAKFADRREETLRGAGSNPSTAYGRRSYAAVPFVTYEQYINGTVLSTPFQPSDEVQCSSVKQSLSVVFC